MRQPIRVTAEGSCEVSTLDAFYERYVIACDNLGAAPLSPEQLLALISALVERTTAAIH